MFAVQMETLDLSSLYSHFEREIQIIPQLCPFPTGLQILSISICTQLHFECYSLFSGYAVQTQTIHIVTKYFLMSFLPFLPICLSPLINDFSVMVNCFSLSRFKRNRIFDNSIRSPHNLFCS